MIKYVCPQEEFQLHSAGDEDHNSVMLVIRFLFYKYIPGNRLENWYKGSGAGDCYAVGKQCSKAV